MNTDKQKIKEYRIRVTSQINKKFDTNSLGGARGELQSEYYVYLSKQNSKSIIIQMIRIKERAESGRTL